MCMYYFVGQEDANTVSAKSEIQGRALNCRISMITKLFKGKQIDISSISSANEFSIGKTRVQPFSNENEAVRWENVLSRM